MCMCVCFDFHKLTTFLTRAKEDAEEELALQLSTS